MRSAAVRHLEYDVNKYLELLERAAWEILEGLEMRPNSGRKIQASRPINLELPLLWGD